jgi:transposase
MAVDTGERPYRRARHQHEHDGFDGLWAVLDGIGAIAGKRGRPRQRPDRVIADRGYDHDKYRRELWRRGIKPQIARRSTEDGSRLGRVRWVVERTFAWLHNFRRLRIRWERDAGLHYALLSLGCSLICWRRIRRRRIRP